MYEGPLDPVSNDEDWTLVLEVVSDDDEEVFDLTGSTASLRINDANGCERLAASSSEITVDEAAGTISVTIPAARLMCLCAGAYTVALRITNGTNTAQLMRATLPIKEGGF
jgi:hypothetical protein